MSKVCVFGAGAVGSYLLAKLIHAGTGHELSVVARGAQLQSINNDGLRLVSGDEEVLVRPQAATENPYELPPQDIVFVTLKAHSQSAAAHDIATLLSDGGVAVFVNNGIPWWWNYSGATSTLHSLPLLDPEAELWRCVDPARVLGCVVYSANEIVRPGVVRHVANNQWLLGEPDNSHSPRLLSTVNLMQEAGLGAHAVDNIRHCVWMKLLRNAPLNTISALTRLSAAELPLEPSLIELYEAVVDEIVAIAAAHGADVSDQADTAKAALHLGAAVDGTRATNIRPSMLQDVLKSRKMEVDSILGQVQAFARATGTPCPTIDTLLPLARGLNHLLK